MDINNRVLHLKKLCELLCLGYEGRTLNLLSQQEKINLYLLYNLLNNPKILL